MTVADWPLESRVFWHLLRSGVTTRADAERLSNEERLERCGTDSRWPDYRPWQTAMARLDRLND